MNGIRWLAISMLLLTSCRMTGPSRGPVAAQPLPSRSQAELVKAYVSAVNANDLGRLRSLVHPKCLAVITDTNRTYFADRFDREFERTIPQQYETTWSPIRTDQPLPLSRRLIYPIRPTHSLRISFNVDPNRTVGIQRFAVLEGDQWWLVIPGPAGE